MIKQFHLIIEGDVQGVGYRSWMRREAKLFGIVGFVKNTGRGSVEAVVQGEEKNIENLIKLCKKGPDVAWVEKVEVTNLPVEKDLFTFEVVY